MAKLKNFMRLTSFVCALAILVSTISCSDPTLVGAALLEEDRANVGFSDTLSITAASFITDSVRTYTPFTSSQLLNYLFGNINDPIFGRSTASIYAQVYPESNSLEFSENTIVDSIVLVLPYDVDNFYGKAGGEEFGIEVLQLAEVLIEDQEYYSNQEVAVDPMPIGSAQPIVRLDSLEFIDYQGTDTATLKFPHHRISLDMAVADFLIGLDSATYANDSLFLDAFKGLHLKPTTENEGMLSFDLLASTAGIYLYYHDTIDGPPLRFLYDFDIQPTVRFTHYEHDYEEALVASFLNGPGTNDSLIFVQGMSGLDAKLEIPNVTDLQGLVVNKAELEIYVANQGGNDDNFAPIRQLILTTPNSDGVPVAVEDIEIILSQRRSLEDLFGGVPLLDPDGGPTVYKMNLTAHFQDIIDGNRENVLHITPFEKEETAYRTVLYGAEHPLYGMKLKLAFTKL